VRKLARAGSGLAIAATLILSACGEAQHISPATRTTPTAPTPAPTPRILSVDEAAALIGRTVTGSRPVLLPKAIPAGYTAQVTVSADDFMVTYASVDGSRHIFFELGVAQPAPPQPDGTQSYPRFRGVTALYQVDSQSPPTSRRFIDWGEPGTASPNLQIKPEYGVPYFLSTEGLAEAEFWQIANSLGPVAGPTS
jgi:hypothetical protein